MLPHQYQYIKLELILIIIIRVICSYGNVEIITGMDMRHFLRLFYKIVYVVLGRYWFIRRRIGFMLKHCRDRLANLDPIDVRIQNLAVYLQYRNKSLCLSLDLFASHKIFLQFFVISLFWWCFSSWRIFEPFHYILLQYTV